jgi:hypothetical protein
MASKIDLHPTLAKLRAELPAVIAGTELDRLTGGAVRWRTLQNEASRGETPAGLLLNIGRRKKIVDRDVLLEHLQAKLAVGEAA